MNAILATLLILGALFGGAAGTAYAAQDDLPDQALYPLKLTLEDIRLQLTNDPEAETDLLIQMMQTRVEEIIALYNAGEVVPGEVMTRLEQHIQQALQVASGMEDAQMRGTLAQLQLELQIHAQVMTNLQAQSQGEESQLLAQTRTMLETRIRIVDTGLVDPQGFRNTVRTEAQDTFEGTPGPGYGQDPQDGSGPGSGNGENGGNGSENPGDGNNPEQTPGDGNGLRRPSATPGGPGRGNGQGILP
ncbi:MAG: DUF5667 domain-containing protein [Chloroflexota bacterium]